MKTRLLSYSLFALVLLFSLSAPGLADTVVGGMITTDTHWTIDNSPYVATQSVLVSGGATLSIDPGVEVRFDPLKALSIGSGQLIARGTETEKIRFTANAPSPITDADRWGYIGFGDDSVDAAFDVDGLYTGGSILEHTIVEFAGGTSVLGAISLSSASPYISHSVVENSANGGIYGKDAVAIRIHANTICQNTFYDSEAYGYIGGGGVLLIRSHQAVLSGNEIRDNAVTHGGGGVTVHESDHVMLADNTVANNTATYAQGGGVNIDRSDYVVVLANIITGNYATGNVGNEYYGGGGLYLFRADNAVVAENQITQNTSHGGLGGGGVMISESRNVSFLSNTISENSVENVNGAGVYLNDNDAVSFEGDVIAGNHGVGLYAGRTGSNIVISADPGRPTSIYGNTGYAIANDMRFVHLDRYDGESNIDARNVWWGTTDALEIQSSISDFFDDSSNGIVFYEPYAIHDPSTLTSVDNGDWAAADTWTGSTQIPTDEHHVLVGSHTVTVTTDALAKSLEITEEAGKLIVNAGVTLDLVEDVTMTAGSRLGIEIGAAFAGQIRTDGNVSLQGGLELKIDSSDPFKAGTFTLITSGSGITGSFATVTGLGQYALSGVSGDGLTYESKSLVLTIDKDLNPGDADLSTQTDLSDFNIWNANKFTAGTEWTSGDFNGDGVTDLSDFNIWNANKFTSVDGGAAPVPMEVPEPGVLALLGLAVVIGLGVRIWNHR